MTHISEKFIENVLGLEFSEFINCTFKEYFEKSYAFDYIMQKINNVLINTKNRLKAIDKISKKLTAYFDEYLLLKILKNTLSSETTFDKQDLHIIRQIMNSLEVHLDFCNSGV